MKIKRLVVQNVMSYKERTEFTFDFGLNILIGTNGGGKTNLQRLIALTLTKFFIHQYQFTRNEQVASIELADPWTQRVLERTFPKYVGDDSEQVIEIELVPEATDTDNIVAIGDHLDELNAELAYWEKKYANYDPLPLVDDIRSTSSFRFVIRNLVLEEPESGTPAWAFLEYLRTFFIFLRVAPAVQGMALSAPVFFFSSDRALSRSFEVQAGQLTEQSYFDGFRSAYHAATGESMNLMQWGAQHFVRLHRGAVIEASATPEVWGEYFDAQADVQLLRRYMGQLGYEWTFWHDRDQLAYVFMLVKDGVKLAPAMFSSGEREIVHFLLAMFALNVRGGLVLVDEPELHLHPRWQRIFLGLFRDLAPERDCQFIITTHSPVFVTPDTINSITRIFRTTASGSRHVALRDVQLPEKKNLVRMINSQNNERLFFADKVVLVEGISDRLVLSSLLESAASLFRNSEAIEVIEVGGKGNFADYHKVLEGLMTRSFVLADRDYLTTVGSEIVKGLFVPDAAKQTDILTKDKRSVDRATLVDHLAEAVLDGKVDELRTFWNYFSSRVVRFKENPTEAEVSGLESDLMRLRTSNVLVLREGDIEDYLPAGVHSIRDIVDLVSDRDWLNRVSSEERRVELALIVCHILDPMPEQRDSFLNQVRSATIVFPEPVSFGGAVGDA